MNWRVKGVIHKTLSAVPGGTHLNDFLQRTVGGLRNFSGQVENKFTDWAIAMSYLNELNFPVSGARCVEIGTGWFPTLPICFSLAGATSCDTYDLHQHLSPRLTRKMLCELTEHLTRLAELSPRSRTEITTAHERLVESQSIEELLKNAGIQYRAPADATRTGLPESSVDIVYSNSVLEHIPAEVLVAMMQESLRILRPGGVVLHGVNCGDHYAYFDRGISAINYLTYTEKQWQFWNNNLTYQNRLRPREFLTMAEAAGLEVLLVRQRAREDLLKLLPDLPVAPDFEHYPPEELCCTSIDFVARKR
jgi:SAM-dependent methyltransferase